MGAAVQRVVYGGEVSSTVISPSWLESPALHVVTGVFPRAMFTIVRISSTVTELLPSQSPTHPAGVGEAVGVSVGVGRCVVNEGVGVGLAVSVAVLVGAEMGVPTHCLELVHTSLMVFGLPSLQD